MRLAAALVGIISAAGCLHAPGSPVADSPCSAGADRALLAGDQLGSALGLEDPQTFMAVQQYSDVDVNRDGKPDQVRVENPDTATRFPADWGSIDVLLSGSAAPFRLERPFVRLVQRGEAMYVRAVTNLEGNSSERPKANVEYFTLSSSGFHPVCSYVAD